MIPVYRGCTMCHETLFPLVKCKCAFQIGGGFEIIDLAFRPLNGLDSQISHPEQTYMVTQPPTLHQQHNFSYFNLLLHRYPAQRTWIERVTRNHILEVSTDASNPNTTR